MIGTGSAAVGSGGGAPLAAGLLAALLLGATLGEGGATPTALLAVHLAVAALLVATESLPLGGPRRAPASAPLAATLLFCAASVAGATVAPYRFAAWLVVVEQAAFVAVAWIAGRMGAAVLVRSAPLLLAGAGAQGALAVVQRWAGGDPRPAGTFLNPNHLGAWLVAGLVIGLGTWSVTPTPGRLAARAALAAPAVAGLFLCGSRGALVGLLAAAACAVPGWLHRATSRRTRGALLAAIGVVTLLAAAGIAVRLRSGDPFLYHRWRIWSAASNVLASSPWLGTGPGQFGVVAANLNFPLEDAPLRYERSFESPHSDLLRAACEFGLPAALVVLAAAALAGASVLRRLRSGALPPAAVGLAAALAGLAAQALVDDLTDRPALYLLFAAIAGGLLSVESAGGARAAKGTRLAAVVALFVALAAGEVAPYLAWRELHGLPRGRLDDDGRARLAAALARNPIHPDAWLRRSEDLSGAGAKLRAADYAAAREAAERAIRLSPDDARYRLGLARLEALACTALFRDVGTRERAERAYAEAIERARTDPFLPLEQGKFLLAAGDAAGARRAAERALAVEPGAVPARLLLAAAILEQGGSAARPRARALLEEADEIEARWREAPRDTPYARTLLAADRELRRGLIARLDGNRSDAPVDRPVDSGAPSP